MSSLMTWARGTLRDKFEHRAVKRALAGIRDAVRDGVLERDPDALITSALAVHDEHGETIADLLAEMRDLFPGAEVKARLKTVASILGKLPRRPDKYAEPELLEDISGAAIIVPTLDDVAVIVDTRRSQYDVTDDDDCIETPKNHGYRAHHLTIIGSDGLPKEIQVRTMRQDAFAQWEHAAYKPLTEQQRDVLQRHSADLLAFCEAASDYLNALDHGQHLARPEPPPYIEAAFGLPWPTTDEADARARLASGEGDAPTLDASQVGERLWVGSHPAPGAAVGDEFDALVLAAATRL